jgi:hypothetical protein
MRHNSAQALSEADRWFVGHTGEDDVIELLKLLRCGANERGMRMPVKATPPRRDAIKDLSTILKCQRTATSRYNRKGLDPEPRLRVRMPYDLAVPSDERGHIVQPHCAAKAETLP